MRETRLGKKIVIVGAGPTGLGAAYRLAELGHEDWEVFERDDHVGGLASSYTDEHGFIWDHGGHVMFSHYSYFDDLVEKMLRGDYDQHMREAWVWMFDRFVPYPFQNNIHRLPPKIFLECIMGIIEAQKSSLTRDNFQNWINSVFGDGIAKHFMMPYNFKVWAHPLEMMSTSWQGDRVPNVDVGRILENLLENRDDVSWGPNNKFKFPLLGTGMLYDRMAEALPKPVNLNEEVASIDPSAKSVTFTSGRTVNYDFLINTMPLKELVKKIVGCPEDVIAATQDLHHTEGMFVGIGVADPCPSTKCWMYFPESDSPFYRVTYLSNYSPKMTPPGDHFSLLAEVSASLQAGKCRRRGRPHHRGHGEQQASHARAGEIQDRQPPAAARALLVSGPHHRARPGPGCHPSVAHRAGDLLARSIRRLALRDREHRPLRDEGSRDRGTPRARHSRDAPGPCCQAKKAAPASLEPVCRRCAIQSRRQPSGISSVRTGRAGTPATTVLAGTSSVTTDPAATTAWSPMVTPGRIVADRPTQTLTPRRTGAIRVGRDGSKGWWSESKMATRSPSRQSSPSMML